MTRDISGKGLYISTETLPPVNRIVRCWFSLRSVEYDVPGLTYHAVAVGRVVRPETDSLGRNVGFAVSTRVVVLSNFGGPQNAGSRKRH